jgi:hypothetical protein
MKKLTALPVWQQYSLCAAFLLPWIALGVFTSDILPEARRFQAWPENIRVIALVLVALFIVADAVFAVWFLFFRSHDNVA